MMIRLVLVLQINIQNIITNNTLIIRLHIQVLIIIIKILLIQMLIILMKYQIQNIYKISLQSLILLIIVNNNQMVIHMILKIIMGMIIKMYFLIMSQKKQR